MYQTFVIGLGVLLLVGFGYFIKHTDSEGVISSTLSVQASSSQAIPTEVGVAGVYICDNDSKCTNPRILTLRETGDLIMNTSFDNGVEMLEEVGAWKINEAGNVLIYITGTNSVDYPASKIIIMSVSGTGALLGKSADAAYEGWGSPIFRKQQNQE